MKNAMFLVGMVSLLFCLAIVYADDSSFTVQSSCTAQGGICYPSIVTKCNIITQIFDPSKCVGPICPSGWNNIGRCTNGYCCKQPEVICSTLYDPVCCRINGVDKTVSNACVCTEQYRGEVISKGECGIIPKCTTTKDCWDNFKSCYYVCINNKCNQITTLVDAGEYPNCGGSKCQNLYWFDNINKECGLKQFCGKYMYEGLRTFNNKEDCISALNLNICGSNEIEATVKKERFCLPSNLYDAITKIFKALGRQLMVN